MSGEIATLIFAAESGAVRSADDLHLQLATAQRPGVSGAYYDGFVNQPEQTAVALRLLARIARTRFWTPPNVVQAMITRADPVVIVAADRIRFESFSVCCGVAARYDLLPGGLDQPPLRSGTTNIDLNPPVRAALADVHGLEPLRLTIGNDVTFQTGRGSFVEEKVPLPDRWVKGFAEAQNAAASLVAGPSLGSAQAARFVRSLPVRSGGRSTLFVAPSREGLGLTSARGPNTVPLGGPSRLRSLEPMLRFASQLTAYRPADRTPEAGVSAWQLDLDQARLTLTLSPSPMRGFSGEGGLLFDLVDRPDDDLTAALLDVLRGAGSLAVADIGARTGRATSGVRGALQHLAALGLVGYDAAEAGYYHRDLPWDPFAVESLHPRLVRARELVATSAVRTGSSQQATPTTDPETADPGTEVGDAGEARLVRFDSDGPSCSCPWFARHGLERGPCAHILAAFITRRT